MSETQVEVTQEDKAVQSEIPTEGLCTVSLMDIDCNVFRNSRKTVRIEAVAEMQDALGDNRTGQQLQNINGSLVKDTGRIGIWAGFTRYEAMCRNAARSVIAEWNDSNSYAESNDHYIEPSCKKMKVEDSRKARKTVSESGEEWKLKMEAALASYPIDIKIIPVKDDKEAYVNSVLENLIRTELPLADQCDQILEMLQMGMKGEEIAKKIKKSGGYVSQIRSVSEIPARMKVLAEKDEASDDEVTLLGTAIEEFNRRCTLDHKSSDVALTLALCRVLGGILRSKKEEDKLNFEQAFSLLRMLVRMDDNGSLNVKKARVNEAIFKSHVSDACKASKFEKDNSDESMKQSMDDLDAIDKLGEDTVQPAATLDDLADVQDEQTAATTVAPEAGVGAEDGDLDELDDLQNKIQETDASLGDADGSIGDIGDIGDLGGLDGIGDIGTPDLDASPEIDDLGGLDGLKSDEKKDTSSPPPKIEKSEKPSDGSLKTKTIDAPTDTIKEVPGAKVITIARVQHEYVTGEDVLHVPNKIVEECSHVASVTALLGLVGHQNAGEANRIYMEFAEGCNAWIESLLEAAEEHFPEEIYSELMENIPLSEIETLEI